MEATSSNVLVRKLESFQPLSTSDRDMLDRHCRPVREIAAKRDIIREGDTPDKVFLILSGFACQYRLIEDGRRQIMAYLVPGDFGHFQIFILQKMDHNVGTLSRCHVVELPREAVLELTERPAIARAFRRATLVDTAVLREWLVNIGQRPGEERIAHLLCELLVRLEAVGLVKDNTYTMPITQADLGDTMGITVVYANRMLMRLRDQGLIEINDKELTVRDVTKLKALGGFNPNYLHLLGGKPSRSFW